MDAQLKYRLTGAVILVLLAVLFVPELLTGPKLGRPGPDPEPATAMADGVPLRSYDIDLGDNDASASARSIADESAGTLAAPGTLARPAPPDDADDVADASSPPSPPRVAAAPATRPVPAAPVASPEIRKPAPATSANPMRGFAVQVGSFASRESADRLAGDLRSRRFETFVTPVRSGGRQMFRVRVGPVEDRDAAQALATRLKGAGQAGTVVSLP